ncbi:hypothetical protein ACER0A_001465 [Haloimpatiens sp. FM7315]|uniref:hypothetical protein n=1 Tax=Haloimpatiens sp. FM7315 TaxID=3298609 RepID=UPI00370BDB5A
MNIAYNLLYTFWIMASIYCFRMSYLFLLKKMNDFIKKRYSVEMIDRISIRKGWSYMICGILFLSYIVASLKNLYLLGFFITIIIFVIIIVNGILDNK